MRVIDFTPYDIGKNLGRAYNECMSLLSNEDYGIIRDRDVIYTTPDYMELVYFHIDQHPNVRAFTATTNRIRHQPQKDILAPQTNDISLHVEYGLKKQKEQFKITTDVTDKHMSGFWMCFKKSLWTQIGGAKQDRLLTIDVDLRKRIRDAGEKILLLNGLYLFHFYSNYDGVGQRDISHLK